MISTMIEADALDTLTGNLDRHKNWCEKTHSERMEHSNDERQFFNNLLEDTQKAFEQSEISKKQKFLERGYSVTATRIIKNKPLIVGFNWGVNKKWEKDGNKYGAQKEYPFRTFEGNYNDLGSLKQSIPYFHKYFPQALGGMQTNFCFFRSEKEDDIESSDLKLSSELFDKFLIYSTPSIVISFSKTLFNYLDESAKLREETKEIGKIKSGNKTIYPVIAKLQYSEEKTVGFVYLPHPSSYRYHQKEAIDNAWKFCFEKINQLIKIKN